MTPPLPSPAFSPMARRAITAIGAGAASLAVLVWVTGGTSITLWGLRLSSRNATRPALLAALCGLMLAWRLSSDDRRAAGIAAVARANRAAPWAAAALAAGLSLTSAIFGAHVAGGADSSGYLSQSRLWASGTIETPIDDIAGAAWPVSGRLVSPLGYAPAATANYIGPTYAPGLPWLMALAAAVAGEPGRYLWTPLLAGLLVWATFALTWRQAPAAVALAAALLVATSPPVLFESMQTMSDLPAAALWATALWCLTSAARGTSLAGGVAAALAVAVRPNLVLVAGALWGAWLVDDQRPLAARLRRAAVFAVPVAMAALAIAAVNAHLWGSPLRSGYGANVNLFSTASIGGNLANLGRWTVEARTYWCAFGLIALAWLAATRRGRAWLPALGVVAAVVASYLPYAVFAEWWYLRFYLPALPLLAAALAVAAWRIVSRWLPSTAVLAVLTAAILNGVYTLGMARDVRILDLWRAEQRYHAVATWVRDHSGPRAVVFAVQHSGALNYYARRTIGRYDWLPSADLDAVCARLSAAGRQVLLVTDDWEEAGFRERFTGQVRGQLDWAPIAEARVGGARVRVYDLATPTRPTAPALIAVPTRSPWPPARRPRLEPAK